MSTNAINSTNLKLMTPYAHNYKMLQKNNSIRTMRVIIVPKTINSYNYYNYQYNTDENIA